MELKMNSNGYSNYTVRYGILHWYFTCHLGAVHKLRYRFFDKNQPPLPPMLPHVDWAATPLQKLRDHTTPPWAVT